MIIEHVLRRLAHVKRAPAVGMIAVVDAADVDVDLLTGPDRLAARQRMAAVGLQS